MFTVIYPAIRVHRSGCADIQRDLRSWKVQHDGGTQEFKRLQGIVDDLNSSYGWPYNGDYEHPDEPAPWALRDLDLAPCAVEEQRRIEESE